MKGRIASKQSQAGVALVSVLLVVVIATLMAVVMLREQNAAIQVTRSFLHRGQAMQYALGGEELARQILHADFALGTGRDHLAEEWAHPELHYEFGVADFGQAEDEALEDGEVRIVITDLQGLLNLGALVPENPAAPAIRQRIVNLAALVGGAPAILDQLEDWTDEDDGLRPLGAEDNEYLGLDLPYRAANAPLVDASELRLMPAMELKTWQRFRAAVTVLPEPATNININTATPLVIQSLVPNISYQAAETLAIRRNEQEGFASVQAFLQAPELAGTGLDETGLGVQSAFFEVKVVARYQGRFSYLTSLVQRNPVDGRMRVIQRDFSRILVVPKAEESPVAGTDSAPRSVVVKLVSAKPVAVKSVAVKSVAVKSVAVAVKRKGTDV